MSNLDNDDLYRDDETTGATAPLAENNDEETLEEALAAEDAGADTIAFGAIFPTATKGLGHPVQGLERLAALAQKVHVPLIAIGGINRQNVRTVVEAGADAVAMITALAHAPDVVAETKWFVDAIASVTRDL